MKRIVHTSQSLSFARLPDDNVVLAVVWIILDHRFCLLIESIDGNLLVRKILFFEGNHQKGVLGPSGWLPIVLVAVLLGSFLYQKLWILEC